MPFDPNPAVDLSDATEVQLGGHAFRVPRRLTLRQNIKIAGLARRLNDLKDGSTEEQLTEFAKIMHFSLEHAYPTLTFEEFVSLPIQISELIAAATIIVNATRAQQDE